MHYMVSTNSNKPVGIHNPATAKAHVALQLSIAPATSGASYVKLGTPCAALWMIWGLSIILSCDQMTKLTTWDRNRIMQLTNNVWITK